VPKPRKARLDAIDLLNRQGEPMTHEAPFRIVLTVVLVVQTAISLRYVRRAGADATIVRRRAEGVPLTVAIAVSYLAYGVTFVAYLVNPGWMAWSVVAVAPWLRWAGVVPLSLGGCWMIWALHHIGENLTVSIDTKEEHALITSGPYRWVRHPLYTGGMVESVGVCLVMANWFVAISAGLFWSLLAMRTPMEERNLVETFGDEYRQYMERVGRFVPKV
jgi:protein-S-isoprenylcysteine O-methyltransferase Ste14